MAKKGAVQQLQADICTDDDFDQFLDRPGLLVLDVYSEWCGPCIGMVGSLRRIKLELGGDNLHLAICKSDSISCLERFRRKSEPTWLFVTKSKAVNLLFGTNVPNLMQMITLELQYCLEGKTRRTYEITELQPEEVERQKVVDSAADEARRIEEADISKNRHDYLKYVTDTIMENMPDVGVSVFGPQVSRDMVKKVMEPADAFKIQCKDRKVVAVAKENFDVVNFMCPNPLDKDVIEQLDQKELLLCFWKVSEELKEPVSDQLVRFAHALTKTKDECDEVTGEIIEGPPIISPIAVQIQYYAEDENVPEETGEEAEQLECVKSDAAEEVTDGKYDEKPRKESVSMVDIDKKDSGVNRERLPKAEERDRGALISKPRICSKTISIPPIWVPHDQRTHAALIYVFFNQATAPFLPPDPVPEPPHVIMAFDSYKKRELIDIADRYKEDITLYGFFTSDVADEAQFIANSIDNYGVQKANPTDKIVFKVSKQTSDIILLMSSHGPTYVSPNAIIGRDEALKFFPKEYKSAEQEALDAEAHTKRAGKKKKKGKSKNKNAANISNGPGEASTEEAVNAVSEQCEDSAQPTGEEDGTTSGEESGDSVLQIDDGSTPEEEEVTAAHSAELSKVL